MMSDVFSDMSAVDQWALVNAFMTGMPDCDKDVPDDDWSEDFERYMTETGWLSEDER